MQQPSDGTPLFLHIPKTAGSSVRTLIAANYLSDPFADHKPRADVCNTIEGRLLNLYGAQTDIFDFCMAVPRQTRNRFQMTQGHMPYGVHDYLGLSNPRYFVFLREPVARMLSDINHAVRHESHGFHQVIADEGLTTADRIQRATSLVYYRNTATHYLSGTYGTRDVTITDFHLALERVRKVEFVGLAEQAELSILMMARNLGWRHVVPQLCNVAPTTVGEGLVAEHREACSHVLAFDIQLHRAAVDRFEEDVALHGALLLEAADQLKELLAIQHSEYPECAYQTYLIGQPLQIPLHEYTAQISATSPLGRWIREEADAQRRAS